MMICPRGYSFHHLLLVRGFRLACNLPSHLSLLSQLGNHRHTFSTFCLHYIDQRNSEMSRFILLSSGGNVSVVSGHRSQDFITKKLANISNDQKWDRRVRLHILFQGAPNLGKRLALQSSTQSIGVSFEICTKISLDSQFRTRVSLLGRCNLVGNGQNYSTPPDQALCPNLLLTSLLYFLVTQKWNKESQMCYTQKGLPF